MKIVNLFFVHLLGDKKAAGNATNCREERLSLSMFGSSLLSSGAQIQK